MSESKTGRTLDNPTLPFVVRFLFNMLAHLVAIKIYKLNISL